MNTKENQDFVGTNCKVVNIRIKDAFIGLKKELSSWIWFRQTFCNKLQNESMFQSIPGVSWIFGTDFNAIQCKIISWWAFEYTYRELQKNITSKKVFGVQLTGLLQGPINIIKVLHDVKNIHEVNRSGRDGFAMHPQERWKV